jgi:hypothetical protein
MRLEKSNIKRDVWSSSTSHQREKEYINKEGLPFAKQESANEEKTSNMRGVIKEDLRKEKWLKNENISQNGQG